jgi:hypothetical protein
MRPKNGAAPPAMVITTQQLIGRRDRPFPGCSLKHTTDKRLMAGFRPLRKNVLFHLLKFFFGYLALQIAFFKDIQGRHLQTLQM